MTTPRDVMTTPRDVTTTPGHVTLTPVGEVEVFDVVEVVARVYLVGECDGVLRLVPTPVVELELISRDNEL